MYEFQVFIPFLITIGLNCLFLTLDIKELKRTGYTAESWLWLGIVIVPIYLFVRAAKTTKNILPGIVWCALLVLSLIIPRLSIQPQIPITPADEVYYEEYQTNNVYEELLENTNVIGSETNIGEPVKGYEQVYNEYKIIMEEATPLLIDEFNEKASMNEKGLEGMFDIYLEEQEKLTDIYQNGLSDMMDAYHTKSSGVYEEYEEWRDKLYDEVYEVQRNILYDAYEDFL